MKKLNIINLRYFVVILVLIIFLSSNLTSIDSFAKTNQKDTTVQETGNNTIIYSKGAHAGPIDRVDVIYNINVTELKSVNVNILFKDLGFGNLNVQQSQIKLTLSILDPSGNLINSVLIDLQSTSKSMTLNPAVLGVYKFKLDFNYTSSIFDNIINPSLYTEISGNSKIQVNNFPGTVWVYTTDNGLSNAGDNQIVNMRNQGTNVTYWLYFNKITGYLFKINIYGSSNIAKEFTLTNKNNRNDSMVFQSFEPFYNIQTFNININALGWWKLEYTENNGTFATFYILSISETNSIYLPFYIPFSDGTSPIFAKVNSNGSPNHITQTQSLNFPVMNIGFFIGVITLLLIKKKMK